MQDDNQWEIEQPIVRRVTEGQSLDIEDVALWAATRLEVDGGMSSLEQKSTAKKLRDSLAANADTIATLRADLAAAKEDNRILAAGSCDVDGGKLGDERGNAYCTLQLKLAKAVEGLEWIEKTCREEIPLEYNDGMRKVFQRNIRDAAQSFIKELKP